MQLERMKKAFTLIELLVVITIIGILATGSVTIFTSQIQKARDTTRISDIKALQSSIEQVYQDSGEYPKSNSFGTGGTNVTGVTTYLETIPTDPKIGQNCNGGTTCSYIYGVSVDDNSIAFGEYEISTAFENKANRTQKGAKDNGNDALRFELGLDVSDDTNHKTNSTGAISVLTPAATKCYGIDEAEVDSTTESIFLNNHC